MAQVKAPFVDAKISTSNPVGSLKSIVLAIAGVALFAMVLAFGSDLGDMLTAWVAGLLGLDMGPNAGDGILGDL